MRFSFKSTNQTALNTAILQINALSLTIQMKNYTWCGLILVMTEHNVLHYLHLCV